MKVVVLFILFLICLVSNCSISQADDRSLEETESKEEVEGEVNGDVEESDHKSGRNLRSEKELENERNNFDWIAYLELHLDTIKNITNEKDAFEHYLTHSIRKERTFYRRIPKHSSSRRSLLSKLEDFKKVTSSIPKENRTVVINHLGIFDPLNAIEAVINNLKIFNVAVANDSMTMHNNNKNSMESSRYLSNNFYIFNVIGSSKGGHLANFLSFFLPRYEAMNIAILDWDATPSDVLTHLRTLSFLQEHGSLDIFGSAFFLNNGVRGPFIGIEQGKWLEDYRKLMFTDPPGKKQKIGIAGPILSCERTPHVQTHAFMLRTEAVPAVLKAYSDYKPLEDRKALIIRYEVSLLLAFFLINVYLLLASRVLCRLVCQK
jgi:hypothetical protein